jgi:5-(carboxyamino)imidazole ribonucleotide mutase
MTNIKPVIALVMGSQSDWETLKHAAETLKQFPVSCQSEIVSAHRTPDKLYQFAEQASSKGIDVIIAGAGGAAHLPGMLAAKTTIPVLGVPIQSQSLNGIDSLLSIVQMPAGIPVATFAIGKPGAINAALFAVAMLANQYPQLKDSLDQFRRRQTDHVIQNPYPKSS